jgi:hypothetical protein
MQLPAEGKAAAGKVGRDTAIATVDPHGGLVTDRTARCGLDRGKDEADGIALPRDRIETEQVGIGQQE